VLGVGADGVVVPDGSVAAAVGGGCCCVGAAVTVGVAVVADVGGGEVGAGAEPELPPSAMNPKFTVHELPDRPNPITT